MRVHRRVRLITGLLAMAGATLLSVPGVRIAAADGSAGAAGTPAPAEAAVCEADQSDPVRTPATAPPSFDPVRQQDIVVLNNRGYNYAEGLPYAPVQRPPQQRSE